MTTCILVILLKLLLFCWCTKTKVGQNHFPTPNSTKNPKPNRAQLPPKGNGHTKMYVFFNTLLSAYFHTAIWWRQPAFIKTFWCLTFNLRPWIITTQKIYFIIFAQTSSVNCDPIVVKGFICSCCFVFFSWTKIQGKKPFVTSKINKSHHISTTILLFLVMWGMEELHLYKFPWG